MEGLAYLTFDADVKEDLVQDKNALLAMCDLAKVCLINVILVLSDHKLLGYLLEAG